MVWRWWSWGTVFLIHLALGFISVLYNFYWLQPGKLTQVKRTRGPKTESNEKIDKAPIKRKLTKVPEDANTKVSHPTVLAYNLLTIVGLHSPCGRLKRYWLRNIKSSQKYRRTLPPWSEMSAPYLSLLDTGNSKWAI